jgi:dihydrofolate reductase
MQAPGRADEDTRGGFAHGGWAQPYNDEVMGEVMGKGMARGGALLFGRRTYEDFATVWSNPEDDNPFSAVLTNRQKYVASTTLAEPLPWANSTVLAGDVPAAVAERKGQDDDQLVVLGSGVLVQALMTHGLVDEFVLLIHPLVLGSGRRLFADGGASADLTLVDSQPTTTGVIIATYRPR